MGVPSVALQKQTKLRGPAQVMFWIDRTGRGISHFPMHVACSAAVLRQGGIRTVNIAGFVWTDGRPTEAHVYLLPTLMTILEGTVPTGERRRLFDLGCGNGSVAKYLADHGWDVTGVDPSIDGISQANTGFPALRLRLGSAYDNLQAQYGHFSHVISLEVVEHVYEPRVYARTLFSLIEPGGVAILSTPYHGYWKNLALSVTGRMDRHFTALWDHGHIKFWSVATLTTLLEETGFTGLEFYRVGRIPPLAKSMIVVARRPVA